MGEGEGYIKLKQTKCFETSHSLADQNTFWTYVFLIKLQNINRIHFNTFREQGNNHMYFVVYKQMGP